MLNSLIKKDKFNHSVLFGNQKKKNKDMNKEYLEMQICNQTIVIKILLPDEEVVYHAHILNSDTKILIDH